MVVRGLYCACGAHKGNRRFGTTKRPAAERMGTGRSRLDRLLDPEEFERQLRTIAWAARVIGEGLRIEMVEAA